MFESWAEEYINNLNETLKQLKGTTVRDYELVQIILYKAIIINTRVKLYVRRTYNNENNFEVMQLNNYIRILLNYKRWLEAKYLPYSPGTLQRKEEFYRINSIKTLNFKRTNSFVSQNL